MVIGASRSARFLLSLFVGVVIALLACAEEPAAFTKGTLAIVVGPKPCDMNYPRVQISKADGEVAIWIARKKTDGLRIEFEKDVFEGMFKLGNGRFVPALCGSRICYSGNIKETTAPSPATEYKYWQVLIDKDGKEDPCDGRMIINP